MYKIGKVLIILCCLRMCCGYSKWKKSMIKPKKAEDAAVLRDNDPGKYETIIQTSDMDPSVIAAAKEVIVTPYATLLKMPVDKLPAEYFVPQKKSPLRYWPNKTIAVDVSASFSNPEQQVIWNALQALSDAVDGCLTFFQKTWMDDDYLFFQKATYCDSRIGYRGGRHMVKLSVDCVYADELGYVQHEILHALGYFHEHSRKDRDNWIDVNWENVKPKEKREFNKLKFRTYDLPYDYLSVMHYGSDAYAINDTIPTLKPTNPVATVESIGQRKGLSPTDIQRIKLPYMCGGLSPSLLTNSELPSRITFSRKSDTQDPFASELDDGTK